MESREGAVQTVLDIRDDETFGKVALVMRKGAGWREFVVAYGYDEASQSWGHGDYSAGLAEAVRRFDGLPDPRFMIAGPDPDWIIGEFGPLDREAAEEIAAAACADIESSESFWDDVRTYTGEMVAGWHAERNRERCDRIVEELGVRDAYGLARALSGSRPLAAAGIFTRDDLAARIRADLDGGRGIDRGVAHAYSSMRPTDLARIDLWGGVTWPLKPEDVIEALAPDAGEVEEAASLLDELEAECSAPGCADPAPCRSREER